MTRSEAELLYEAAVTEAEHGMAQANHMANHPGVPFSSDQFAGGRALVRCGMFRAMKILRADSAGELPSARSLVCLSAGLVRACRVYLSGTSVN